MLAFSVKIGDRTEWSDHKLGAPRFFQYWQESSLRALLADCGFDVLDLTSETGSVWDWLLVTTRPVVTSVAP